MLGSKLIKVKLILINRTPWFLSKKKKELHPLVNFALKYSVPEPPYSSISDPSLQYPILVPNFAWKNNLLPYVLFFITLSFQTRLPYPSLFCNLLISSAIFEWHSIQKDAFIRQQSSDEKHTDHHPLIDCDKAQPQSIINLYSF